MSKYIFIMPKEQRMALYTQARNEAAAEGKSSKADQVYSEKAKRMVWRLEHKRWVSEHASAAEESLRGIPFLSDPEDVYEEKEELLGSVLELCEKKEKLYHWYAPFQKLWGEELQKIAETEQNQEHKRKLLENADMRFAMAMKIYEAISEVSWYVGDQFYFSFLMSIYSSLCSCASMRVNIAQDQHKKQSIIEYCMDKFEQIIQEYADNDEAYSNYVDFLYDVYKNENDNERKKYFISKSVDMHLNALEFGDFRGEFSTSCSTINMYTMHTRIKEYIDLELNPDLRMNILHDTISKYRNITKRRNYARLTGEFAKFLREMEEYEFDPDVPGFLGPPQIWIDP